MSAIYVYPRPAMLPPRSTEEELSWLRSGLEDVLDEAVERWGGDDTFVAQLHSLVHPYGARGCCA